jgi:hypothetical protein
MFPAIDNFPNRLFLSVGRVFRFIPAAGKSGEILADINLVERTRKRKFAAQLASSLTTVAALKRIEE